MKEGIQYFLVSILFSSVGARDARIVGGHETTIEEHPYQLILQTKYADSLPFYGFACGAVIISDNAALTAAHCVAQTKESSMRLGSGSVSRFNLSAIHYVTKLIVHPNYSPTTVVNDIALLIVEPQFVFSETTQPIPLATQEPEEGQNVSVTGWGIINDMFGNAVKLREVVLPVVAREDCRRYLNNSVDVTADMFCAGFLEGGKDSCSGDSGGPVILNGTLAGLVSWGEGCAEPNKPGVYTNIAYFYSWVQDHLSPEISTTTELGQEFTDWGSTTTVTEETTTEYVN